MLPHDLQLHIPGGLGRNDRVKGWFKSELMSTRKIWFVHRGPLNFLRRRVQAVGAIGGIAPSAGFPWGLTPTITSLVVELCLRRLYGMARIAFGDRDLLRLHVARRRNCRGASSRG
jgi:hypothetical protein